MTPGSPGAASRSASDTTTSFRSGGRPSNSGRGVRVWDGGSSGHSGTRRVARPERVRPAITKLPFPAGPGGEGTTQASNQIKAFLVEADDELRARLHGLRKARFGRACAALEPADALQRALAALDRRFLALDAEARELEAQITALIRAHAPKLLARHGVGAVTAAQLLVTAGANPDRLRGDAALAALCGTSPVEASSGKTSRHRLNRGGDRAANNALWVIVHVRTISNARTRAFVAKRTATGNSRREIIRMLQRYIARELYPLIIEALRAAAVDGLT